MALKVLQAYCCKLLKNIPVQNAIQELCITSEFPPLLLVVAQKLVTTTQLYSNEFFPSAAFIHQCQNSAFTVCPHGNCVNSLVPAAPQSDLGWRLIRVEFIWMFSCILLGHVVTGQEVLPLN